jgi:hypothetical protein
LTKCDEVWYELAIAVSAWIRTIVAGDRRINDVQRAEFIIGSTGILTGDQGKTLSPQQPACCDMNVTFG